METYKRIKIGFRVPATFMRCGYTHDKIMNYLSEKENFPGRIALTLDDYLVKYTKIFDRTDYYFNSERNSVLPNGTLTGFPYMISRGAIDMAITKTAMTESSMNIGDFVYPYNLYSFTFITKKSEIKPDIFGILRTFSWQLWIAIFSTLILISLVCYFSLHQKYTLNQVLFNVLAVLLKQSSILQPATSSERLFLYSWGVGAMFICLAYDSVFLSFLAFPSIYTIKDVPQLAKAVRKGDYHCIAPRLASINDLLITSNQENLRVIGEDIKNNNLSSTKNVVGFFKGIVSQNLAFITDSENIDVLSVGNKFVSKDRFLETMYGMMVRKDFCCKKVIDTFVHRLMASGLYSKYSNDKSFLLRLPILKKHSVKDRSKRSLTLIDLASAFIVLITGYFLSILILIGEIFTNYKKCKNYSKESQAQITRNV